MAFRAARFESLFLMSNQHTELGHIEARRPGRFGRSNPLTKCARNFPTLFDPRPLGFGTALTIFPSMPMPIDKADYSVVVKLRAPPPNSWKWEIYRAGRLSPIEQASVYFHTMAAASRAGKEALKQLHSQYLRWPAA